MRNLLEKRNGEAMHLVADLRVDDARCSGKAMLPAREVTFGQGDVAQQANCRDEAVSENQENVNACIQP